MNDIEEQLVELIEPKNPTIEYRQIIDDSGQPGYVNRLMIGTAVTGKVWIQWVGARYGATIPVNWSQVEMTQQVPQVHPIATYYPLRYQVAEAQNLIVKECLFPRGHAGGAFEWLLLLEHDVLITPETFLLFNEYLQGKKAPIVSGLYYTRKTPETPLVFRGRGTGYYEDWNFGDKVYVDGLPTGLLLIHSSILQKMWDDSPEYMVMNTKTRRVFHTPRSVWRNPVTGWSDIKGGTSDLDWCTRVMEGDYIRKAGWEKYWDELPDKQYPFIIDTRIFAGHIDEMGSVHPREWYQISAELSKTVFNMNGESLK